MSDLHDRLREARSRAGFKSARSAALRFDWRPSTYAAHENGQNSFDAGQATVYAKAFKVDLEWLYFGTNKSKPEAGGYVHLPSGFVYDNGLVSMVVKSNNNQVMAYNIFTLLPNDVTIFHVLDESLWPQHEKNELIVCWPSENLPKEEFYGSESIVKLEDGSLILRQIEASRDEGRYNLVSRTLPLIRSAKIVNAWTKIATIAKAGYGSTALPVRPDEYPRLEDSPRFRDRNPNPN